MADNTRGGSESGTAPLIATDEVSYSGETADVQLFRLVNVVGAEGSKTVEAITTGVQYVEDTALTANAGQGTLVVARRDDALAALTPVEDDAVGLRVNNQGALWTAVGAALPAGTNNIGDVDVVTLPALVAGTANIGDVDVLTLPALVAGSANIGDVDVLTLPALPAGTNNIGDVDVLSLPRPDQAITPIGVSARYTTAQTSTIIGPTNGAGTTMVVTSFQIDVGGTVGGDVTLYFGTGAFSRGTSLTVFDGGFLPSATTRPGAILSGMWESVAGDELRITSTNSQNPLTVTINYYTF